jgi:Flp pilus assembly pilin Flp
MNERLARLHAWYLWHSRHFVHDDDGQATTEYALVLLGAALVALMLVAWATAGGGAGKIGRLFDRVIDAVIDKL